MTTFCRIVLCVVALSLSAAAAARADQNIQQAFYKAVATGQAGPLTAIMTPELAQQVDEPVLGEWVNAVNTRLGSVTGITETSRIARQTFGGARIETEATVQFEKGTAQSRLSAIDGRLLSFDVSSEQLGDDWFHGPQTTELYQQRGEALIRKIMENDADSAYDLCHDVVHEAVDRDSFRELVGHIAENGGTLTSATFTGSQMQITSDSQSLLLNYEVACTRASGTCEVKIQFIGLKGHLMGFHFR